VGPSGSGKSTLNEHRRTASITPDEGRYWPERARPWCLRDAATASSRTSRNREIGFIFQTFALLPRATALQNVELPLVYAKLPRRERLKRATEALDRVGARGPCPASPRRTLRRPAAARGDRAALVTNPSLLLADEPTGNLDTATGEEISGCFEDLHGAGNTVSLVTHDAAIAARARRVLRVLDGRIVGDTNENEHLSSMKRRLSDRRTVPAVPERPAAREAMCPRRVSYETAQA